MFDDKDWRHKSLGQLVRGNRFPGIRKTLSFSVVTTCGAQNHSFSPCPHSAHVNMHVVHICISILAVLPDAVGVLQILSQDKHGWLTVYWGQGTMAMWRNSCGWCVPMLAWALPEALLWTGAMRRCNLNPRLQLLFALTAQKAQRSFRQEVGLLPVPKLQIFFSHLLGCQRTPHPAWKGYFVPVLSNETGCLL